ncbi:MAG TPA: type IV pilus assembly protein PilM [Tepidisphaeraceae bacterium]|jgi:type IV pilus assembly protein PilM
MATPRFAWGIDVGNRALKAIRLSPGPDGLHIDDFDVVEHEQVLSNAGDNKDTLIQSALANFVQRHDMRGGVVAVGVSGQSSFARFIKLPPVEPKRIPEIVGFEAKQQIPFPLPEVEWSYQLFQDPGSPDVEVGIFAMRKELVSQHIKVFTDMGLNVQVVQMNPLAVYNAMYHDERLKGTTMIIDLGAENTDLIIAEGETIWLRSIPIGGNNFTETLVKAFKLKFPKAEELKRNASTSKYGRQILQAMKPVFNDLVAEIQRSIGFYASVHRDSRIARVLALGGTFRLPGLQKYVQQNLQIDVHRIDRLGAGTPADARAATSFNENILSSCSAYGLAIQALGGAKITSSLLPQRIRREKMWQEKTRWFAAAAAVFVAAPLVAYGSIYWGSHSLDDTQAIHAQNLQKKNTFKGFDGEWKAEVEEAGSGDRMRSQNYNSLQTGREIQPALISGIIACLPPIPPALSTALESGDKAKLPPRSSRDIVQIDRISMEYHADMNPMLALPEDQIKTHEVASIAPKFGSNGTINRTTAGRQIQGTNLANIPPAIFIPGGAQNAAAAPAGGPLRGYVIDVICTTPRPDGASYVLNNFVSKLEKLQSSTPLVNYAVKKVREPYFTPVGNVTQAGGGARPANNMFAGGARPGAMGAMNPAVAAVEQPKFNPNLDPRTGEDMSADIRVTIRMMVVLDQPAAPATGTAAAN